MPFTRNISNMSQGPPNPVWVGSKKVNLKKRKTETISSFDTDGFSICCKLIVNSAIGSKHHSSASFLQNFGPNWQSRQL